MEMEMLLASGKKQVPRTLVGEMEMLLASG
jgi:hypothetical protein